VNTYTCGTCAATFTTKGDKRRHKETCRAATDNERLPAEYAHSFKIKLTPAEKAEADRQWIELEATGGDPAAIMTWVRNGIRQDDARRTLVQP